MVTVIVGDLFESDAQTLVNTVNCVGVMGKGIALEFKKRFPGMFKEYVVLCEKGKIALGRPYLHKSTIPPWILNFPTKDHWKSVSKLKDIIKGLDYLKQHYKEWGITSLAVPPLGTGYGQLEWAIVGPTLYRKLDQLDIPVELYAPFGTPKSELTREFLNKPSNNYELDLNNRDYKLAPGMVALVDIVDEILKEPYHWPIGRTTFQKIAYFATQEGIPTGLDYQQGSYGPFAPKLKSHITKLVNNGVLYEEKLGQMFAVKPGHTFPDAREAYKDKLDQWSDIKERIVDLFLRMRTKEAELASTVHFTTFILYRKEDNFDEMDVLNEIKRWKARRNPPLDEHEVASTIRNLNILQWINVNVNEDLPVEEEV